MAIVQIFTTGGTIASRRDPASGAVVPVVGADELVRQVPGLAELAEVRVEEFGLHSSWNVTPALAASWARRVGEVLSAGPIAGAVIAHGTDTLEETAFALDLLWDGPAPIVVTGAMRSPSEPGPDGPRNLHAAVRVAADPSARGAGVVVVLNDEVHAARDVTKGHATALGAFRSPGGGVLAQLDEGGIRWLRAPPRPPALPRCDPEPRVYLVKMAAGMDDLLVRAVLDGGGRGLVLEGAGAGNVPAGWEDAITALVRAGVPVVLTTRTGAGRVVPSYGGPGGGRRLVELGVMSAGALGGPKARIALAFALGAGLDPEGIRAYLARLGGAA